MCRCLCCALEMHTGRPAALQAATYAVTGKGDQPWAHFCMFNAQCPFNTYEGKQVQAHQGREQLPCHD